jgi:hypothetical protein
MSLTTVALLNGILAVAVVAALAWVCRIRTAQVEPSVSRRSPP